MMQINDADTKSVIPASVGRLYPVTEELVFEVPQTGIGSPAPIRVRMVRITPKMAEEWLEKRHDRGTPDIRRVAALAVLMPEWMPNGETIIFDDAGKLADGEYRLRACIKAKEPFWSIVVENLPSDALPTIDQHRRRAYTNVLESKGEKYASSLMTALRKLILYDKKLLLERFQPISWRDMDGFLETNPHLRESVKFALDRGARGLADSVRVPLVCMGNRADRQALLRFLDAFANPDSYDADEPGRVLSLQVETLRSRGARYQVVELFALAILGLNATIEAKKVKRLAWKRKDGEGRSNPFPELIGYPGLIPMNEAVSEAARRSRDFDINSFRDWRYGVIEIGEKEADDFLMNNPGNRKVVDSHLATLGRDMAAGRYKLNFKPICFGPAEDPLKGRVLNGQHRLGGVKRSGVRIQQFVVCGVPEACWETYDQAPRRPVQIDDLIGATSDESLIKATATLLWQETAERTRGRPKPSSAELRQVIEENPGLFALRHYAARANRSKLGTMSVILWAAYKILRDDPELAVDFLRKLETGENLERRNPILKLRDTLRDWHHSKMKAPTREAIGRAIYDEWKKFQAGAKSKRTILVDLSDHEGYEKVLAAARAVDEGRAIESETEVEAEEV